MSPQPPTATGAPIVTRFAPSPTGFLHIGGARTALFNWHYARAHGGRFVLRIEDTDRKRHSEEAVDAILDGLAWLGLDWDGEAVSQFSRRERHAQIAQQMVDAGHAYPCYASAEDLAAEREAARAAGKTWRYDGRWRDRDASDAPPGIDPVIRLKAPQVGSTVIEDGVQGRVEVPNEDLDDMVLLRSDGSPTYMLSVVVDDHDMGVTDIVRGDDHLTNAFRQAQIFQAMGWALPRFAHIPLIHGPDGKKLSKRHGALGVEAYRDMGYLPEALRNYLMRLGWGHGDMEVFSDHEVRAVFSLEGIGRGASRFDVKKLESLNSHYLRTADDNRLTGLVLDRMAMHTNLSISDSGRKRVHNGMAGLKERAKTLIDLSESAMIYASDEPLPLTDKAAKALSEEAKDHLATLSPQLETTKDWSAVNLETIVKDFCETHGLGMGKIAQPLRAALTGTHISPSVFEMLIIFGKQESIRRIRAHTR